MDNKSAYLKFCLDEQERMIDLYTHRLQCLKDGNEELELVKVINRMKQEEASSNTVCEYDGMTWGELVLHYHELFQNKIRDCTNEITELKAQLQQN